MKDITGSRGYRIFRGLLWVGLAIDVGLLVYALLVSGMHRSDYWLTGLVVSIALVSILQRGGAEK